ncbi:glycosyltransferase family 2 protein [Listeria sp. PSOL-1]|uniref:glycosyltransferase family 2 protein n=1 Tax=Listeria sp. PSOL-1 TaxID=1844999 RepID=UPI0013D30E58|nr:glycosyltransferase family 2 protein [Listeria sp. PSOL-1]
MNALVSVIVPVFNTAAYLERCLDSIEKQSYPHLEIIVINDGSTDDSVQLIKKHQDPRIKLIEQENKGQASARNHGLDIATGEYVMMVDSDDYISKDLVATCLEQVEKTQADLVIFTSYNVNQNGDKLYIPRHSGYKLMDAGSVPWNKFYHRDLWRELRFPVGYWYEDLGIVPVTVLRAKNPVQIDDALYYYIVDRADSQSNITDNAHLLDVIPMLENMTNELEKLDLYEENKRDIEYLYMEHLIYRTILRKMIFLKPKSDQKKRLKEIRQAMYQAFPNWRKNGYNPGTGLTNQLKKWAVRSYLAGQITLGNLIWKYPFELRRKQTGF